MSFGVSAKEHQLGYPITVFYAFKQAESDDDGGTCLNWMGNPA